MISKINSCTKESRHNLVYTMYFKTFSRWKPNIFTTASLSSFVVVCVQLLYLVNLLLCKEVRIIELGNAYRSNLSKCCSIFYISFKFNNVPEYQLMTIISRGLFKNKKKNTKRKLILISKYLNS